VRKGHPWTSPRAFAAGRDALTPTQIQDFTARYLEIVDAGLAQNPRNKAPEGVRVKSSVKQTRARNLRQRLDRYPDDTLRFMPDFRVPYTNNRGEHDIRMIKVRQKMSGRVLGVVFWPTRFGISLTN